jgi:hypothetical protein
VIRGKVPTKPKGKPFTMAEASPKRIRKGMGNQKDQQAAKNMNSGGDNAMNITPSFEEMARSKAAER